MPTWLRIVRLPFALAFGLLCFPFMLIMAILVLVVTPEEWEAILDSARDIPRALWPEGP